MATLASPPSPRSAGAYNARGNRSASPQELAKQYLPLVKSIVAKMRLHIPPELDLEDVFSIGVYGLMSAVQSYDPSRGVTLGAYASQRIRGAILDELRKLDWLPRRWRAEAKRLNAEKEALRQELQREPTSEELAECMELTPRQLAELEEQLQPITLVNLDAEAHDDSGTSRAYHDLLDDRTLPNARETVQDRERVALLRDAITELEDTPKKILAMYYFEKMRLAEIAEVFGLSESRICQIHGKAVSQLRRVMRRLEA